MVEVFADMKRLQHSSCQNYTQLLISIGTLETTILINNKNHLGLSPIFSVILLNYSKNKRVGLLLLENGADIMSTDNEGLFIIPRL